MLVATKMCEEKSPTISIIAPLLAQLLSDTTATIEDSSLVREIKTAILRDLSRRYDSMEEKKFLRISSALDPRFKSLQFLLPQDAQDTNTKLMEMAAALKEDDADMDTFQVSPDDKEGSPDPQTPETSAVRAHTPRKRKSALTDLLGQTFKMTHQRLSASSLAEREVKQYLDAPPLALTDDPLHWWKSHAQAYPLLAKLAQRHLCVPGTSVPAERVFSTAGDIISSQRSCLTSEHADQLLFLKKNMLF
ncbi:E3 SUMO-protein ligase ZBED1-like [Gadus chalcogrammus]|uniref:E3 SUMO-protein ligase ZBED1-like n=1 Tax=Gadus chalcogrammus TaxID=1042646 RepID=UPI0024C4DD93|nr:E3 SUMO-protein ligase ZBED1-like [Gadus chalcogrammus]